MLYDLLQKEPEMRQGRAAALAFLDRMSQNLDSNAETAYVDQQVTSQMSRQETELNRLKETCSELEREEKQARMKIKKKSQELERMRKQLSRLTTVRPAFMDEYEKHEEELGRMYDQYLELFRNLDYLEHELDWLNKQEEEKMEENERALKRMQKKLRDEEWRLLRGEAEGDDDMKQPRSRPKPKPKAAAGAPGGPVMYGSMDAADDSDNSDTDLSEEIVSDSDPPISLGNSSDDDILEETDES